MVKRGFVSQWKSNYDDIVDRYLIYWVLVTIVIVVIRALMGEFLSFTQGVVAGALNVTAIVCIITPIWAFFRTIVQRWREER